MSPEAQIHSVAVRASEDGTPSFEIAIKTLGCCREVNHKMRHRLKRTSL